MSQDTLLLRANSLEEPLPFLLFHILPCSCHPQLLQAAAHPQNSSSEPSFSHTLGDRNKTNKCYCGAQKNVSAILLLPPGPITWLSKHPILTSCLMQEVSGAPLLLRGHHQIPQESLAASSWLPKAGPCRGLWSKPAWPRARCFAKGPSEGSLLLETSGQEDRHGARHLEALLFQTHPAGPQPPSVVSSPSSSTALPPAPTPFLLQTAAPAVPIAHHLPCFPYSQQFQHLPLDQSHCLILGLPLLL